MSIDVEALENFLDDAWPREGGRSHIVRVLAKALADAGFREPSQGLGRVLVPEDLWEDYE